MTGSVRSWIHYLQVRTEAGTQKEHRVVAEQIKRIFDEQFPNIAKALEPAEEPATAQTTSFWSRLREFFRF